MDALALLTADHNRVRGMFARFQEAKDAEDVATMAELCQKIFTELEVHTTIEEELFYPRVRDESEDLQEVVDEGVEEHHVVKVLMEALEARKKELGAPTLADKIDLTKSELDEKAKEQQIPGRSKMDHDELAATVAP